MNFLKSFSNFFIISFVFSMILNCLVMAETSAESAIHFNKAKNTLSVRLADTNLEDIAEILSKKAGIKVFLDKRINYSVTSAFQNEPLESGIKRLLGPGISSAFIFMKDRSKSGEVVYRLDTVKIFSKGNQLSADFKRFEKRIPEEKASKAPDIAHPKPRLTPGVISHEIMKARKNLDLLHMKEKVETERVQKKIIGLNMKLSQNPSPEERIALVKQLNHAQQSLGTIKSINSRLIMNEEQNVRELIEEKRKIETKEEFIERERGAGKHENP